MLLPDFEICTHCNQRFAFGLVGPCPFCGGPLGTLNPASEPVERVLFFHLLDSWILIFQTASGRVTEEFSHRELYAARPNIMEPIYRRLEKYGLTPADIEQLNPHV